MEITLDQLADLVGGRVTHGDGGQVLTGFAAVDEAGAGDLTFFGNERYLVALQASSAGAALVPAGFDPAKAGSVAGLVEVENPSAAFAVVTGEFGAPPRPFRPGVHPSAVVADGVRFDPENVSIGAQVVVEAGCAIGDGTTVGHGCVVGEGTTIGRDCFLHANVTVREGTKIGDRVILQSGCVIGADGFGYELVDGRYLKIEQAGTVELGDDVEIGACATVDRARFGCTKIGEGTKIDNLVQIAHNCVIGKHTAAAALVGVSGSTRIGDHVVLAGQAGVAGHVTVPAGSVILGRAGVTKSLDAPGKYLGYPATTERAELKSQAAVRRLPALMKRVAALEARLAELGAADPASGDGDPAENAGGVGEGDAR